MKRSRRQSRPAGRLFPHIPLRPVRSESVERLGYNREHELLDVQFAGGSIYRYFGVPPEASRALDEASSIGGYVNQEIKPRFRFQRLL